MAPLLYFGSKKLLLFSALLFLFVSLSFTASSQPQLNTKNSSSIRRTMLESSQQEEEDNQLPLKKKPTTNKNTTKLIKPTNLSSKNQTKTIKPNPNNNLSSKNQTKAIKPNTNNNLSSKNQTKTIKSNTGSNLSSKNQTKLSKTTLTDTGLKKKLNSTTTLKTKKLNNSTSTKPSNSTKLTKSLDLAKSINSGAKNKTTKVESEKPNKQSNKKQQQPSWLFDEEDAELVSEIKDLPVKFQQTLLPDLERISTTSKAYITKANKEITKGFKPYVGNKYAPTIAVLLSCACVLIPLLFVSLLFNKIKAYFSLQKLLIFVQAYLSIYFTILCLSSLVTGLEPLRFFYSTSQSTYVCLQILQTLGYVLYLLLLLMYLVLVFSTDSGLGSRFLGLAQTFLGFAVGLHYYMTVFHKAVLRQPPKTNWKVHGIYATCFVLICVLATADRRKKTYLEEGGEEGKKN